MKTLLLGLTGCILVLSGLDTLAQQTSAAPATLKVSIVIPEIYYLDQQPLLPRTLINQQSDARFHVVIENVSDHPILLKGNGTENPLSFELTEADGSVAKIAQRTDKGKNINFAFRLAPGELHVCEVYYTTQEQYFAVTRHAPDAGRMWQPEFPFTLHKDKTVTLRAIYEQSPSDSSPKEKLWVGRVVSAAYSVVLDYP